MYALLSIPFLFAAGYYHCAYLIKNAGKFVYDDDGERFEVDGVPIKVLDAAEEQKVGRLLGIMLLCYWPAYPIVAIGRWISKKRGS